jgi:alkanesulfonate monooxygenase SsuD/methylene tetrahydromethanopterin reductase-like flavin-dependent oxidoreductase (luciferase family)
MYLEALECLMRGFKNEKLDFEGKYYSYSNVPMTLKPVQKPHPELWYGVLSADTTEWAAQNDVNFVTLALDVRAREITDRFRQEWAKLGKPADKLPLMGVSRHVVVADTDEEAKAIAREAYSHWIDSFDRLWRDNGTSVRIAVPPVAALYPETWDELEAIGNGIAGSPETVRKFVLDEAERTGINYLVSWFAFGNMTVEQVTRSVELFAARIMPAFAQAEAAAA